MGRLRAAGARGPDAARRPGSRAAPIPGTAGCPADPRAVLQQRSLVPALRCRRPRHGCGVAASAKTPCTPDLATATDDPEDEPGGRNLGLEVSRSGRA